MNLTATSLTLPALPQGTASLDVRFDGTRVWSIDVRGTSPLAAAGQALPWPEALRPLLSGSTRVSLADSATGAEISAAEVSFTDEPHRTSITDASGTALAVNKWGRLGVALEYMGAEAQRLIVQRAAEIVEFLAANGLRPFVVGGTLLGAVRAGGLLPHDDDADIAYLSRHTSPADVAIEAFHLGHALTAAGYEVKRHSATHMQLLFNDGPVPYYIDVFTAFFTPDGQINQPFHVRGAMREDQMLPFGTVAIAGTQFPAPADTEHWLTINYDENWRTPIPGFQLHTPEGTRRRFDGWFGAFNLHRDFWDEFFAAPAEERTHDEAAWAAGRAWLASADSRSGSVIDLGCGSGALTRDLATQRPGCRVIGADFSAPALSSAAAHGLAGEDRGRVPEYAHVNLYRATALALPRELSISGAFDLVANNVFEQLGHHGREFGWRLCRMALRSGGNAHFTFHGKPAADVHFDDPTGWHLTREQVTEEASRFGLVVTFESLAGDRDLFGATVALSPHSAQTSVHAQPSKEAPNV